MIVSAESNPWYAITQTLKPKYYKQKAEQQLQKTAPLLLRLLQQTTTEYHLIAELTSQTNIHYHMRVKFLDKFTRDYYSDNSRILGHSLIKPIDDLPGWITYMNKDLTRTRELIPKVKIMYNKTLLQTFDVPLLHQMSVAGMLPIETIVLHRNRLDDEEQELMHEEYIKSVNYK